MLDERQIHAIFRSPPRIETQRLLLRKISVFDAKDMYEYACREDVARYMTWYPYASLQASVKWVTFLQKQYLRGNFWDWGLVYRENRKFIGTCGFTSFDLANDTAEIGYCLNPAYWGQGIMPEAVRAVLRYGFEVLGCHRIEAKFMAENTASRRVMEKCGMRFEGFRRDAMVIKEHYATIGVCAILENEPIAGGQRNLMCN